MQRCRYLYVCVFTHADGSSVYYMSCIFISIFPSGCIFRVFVSVCVSFVFPSVSVSLFLSVCLSVCQYVRVCLFVSICSCVCMACRLSRRVVCVPHPRPQCCPRSTVRVRLPLSLRFCVPGLLAAKRGGEEEKRRMVVSRATHCCPVRSSHTGGGVCVRA